MEYEFYETPYGTVEAHCSMGHEALAHWFSDELGGNRTLAARLRQAVEQLQQRQRWEFELAGQQFSLLLTREEAHVQAHALAQEAHWEAFESGDDSLQNYSAESQASCGLPDFAGMLEDWCRFNRLD